MEEAGFKDNRKIILRNGTGDGTFYQLWEEVIFSKVRKRIIELWLLHNLKNAMANRAWFPPIQLDANLQPLTC